MPITRKGFRTPKRKKFSPRKAAESAAKRVFKVRPKPSVIAEVGKGLSNLSGSMFGMAAQQQNQKR